MRLFVAIDVSSEKLDVCFLDSHDTVLKEICLSNDVNGANAIKEDVLHFHQLYNYEKIVIGMESTSVYSFHPSMFLTEDKDLRALDVEVVVQNPKAIHRYKKLFEEDKTDFESERTPMTRTGNQYLRYYMVEAANSVQLREATYRTYYLNKYDEVPKYKHKRALVLTARKLVHLVDVLLRNHQLYMP